MRVFKAITGLQYKCPSKCCLFCKYCTDIFVDYTHGPYMIICEKFNVNQYDPKQVELGLHGKCKYFEDQENEMEK